MPNASVKIKLDNDIQVNGQKIPAGTHNVTLEQAKDWKRIDDDYSRQVSLRHKSTEVNAANLSSRVVG